MEADKTYIAKLESKLETHGTDYVPVAHPA